MLRAYTHLSREHTHRLCIDKVPAPCHVCMPVEALQLLDDGSHLSSCRICECIAAYQADNKGAFADGTLVSQLLSLTQQEEHLKTNARVRYCTGSGQHTRRTTRLLSSIAPWSQSSSISLGPKPCWCLGALPKTLQVCFLPCQRVGSAA